MRLLGVALVCAVIDAAAAAAIGARSGVGDADMLALQALAGAAVGFVTCIVLGIAIKRWRSIGYVLAAAGLLALLILTAWMATGVQNIIAAAMLANALPLYVMAAVITALLVHPEHADR